MRNRRFIVEPSDLESISVYVLALEIEKKKKRSEDRKKLKECLEASRRSERCYDEYCTGEFCG